MFWSKDWFFAHIPKSGGTNFLDRSEEILGKYALNMLWGFDKIKNIAMHQPLWYQYNNNVDQRLPVITIARNPYARAVSFYNHLIESEHYKNLTFYEFLTHQHFTQPKQFVWKDYDWYVLMPAVDFLKTANGIADVKYFKIETDLDKMEKYVGYIFSDTTYNKKEHRPYQEYYTNREQDIVKKIWEKDFEFFNYSLVL